jgi:uncharacterized protein YegL
MNSLELSVASGLENCNTEICRFNALVSFKNTVPCSTPILFDIYLLLDKSGSMDGKKIENLKKAVKHLLSNMGSNHRFSVITFNDKVELICPLQEAISENIKQAQTLTSQINPSGSTAIFKVLEQTIKMIEGQTARLPVVFLFTDGQDTVMEGGNKKLKVEKLAMESQSNVR